MKFNMKTLNQNHRTFPANVSVHSIKRLKSSRGQENVTLLINRRNSLRQKPWSALCHKVNKRALLLFISICMGLLIIYANSEQFLRQKIFSMFLLTRDKQSTQFIEGDGNSEKFSDGKSTPSSLSVNSLSANLRMSTYFVNVSTQIELRPEIATSLKYNIFVIYTKENYHLHTKFELFIHSLLKHSSAKLHLHIITDKISSNSVSEIINNQVQRFRRTIIYTLYDVNVCSNMIKDISSTLSTYFSSSPNSYYGDSLFFLSLGLYRIADTHLDRAVLLDCDIVFRSDVRLLFKEFERFLPYQLFGLAPELTPVYRHILYRYRVRYPKTNFGSPYYPMYIHRNRYDQAPRTRIRHGYPGLNSGVVMLQLQRIRLSEDYTNKLTISEVQRLVTKYNFKGHLGDQDFFTLLGYEYPNLIYRLDCIWNRQLCTWWKDHGYSDIFDAYFRCDGVIQMYHGNCNTRIPE